MNMNEENIKRFHESVHSLYNTIVDKPLQVFSIFSDFFGKNEVDIQGICSEYMLRSWLELEPIIYYFSANILNIADEDWKDYSSVTITELPQDKFELALSLLLDDIIVNSIAHKRFNNISILVHFPHVKVTNEHGRYVDINHLWAKIKITSEGTMVGNFALNRSEYSVTHFKSNFMHSHVSAIPIHNFTEFQVPCTGEGPINKTMGSLNVDFDSDLWQLFCLELSKFVTVESINGVPYHYLERIGTDGMQLSTSSFTVFNSSGLNYSFIYFKEFVKYFIQGNRLKFNYVNGSYSIGMSYIEFIVLISNEFIKWYNKQFNDGEVTTTFEELKRNFIVFEVIINNNKIYYNTRGSNNINNIASYIGKKICTFKGKEITLNIADAAKIENKNTSIILQSQIALFILNQILKVLNYKYGREKTTTCTENQTGTKVWYL